MAFCRRTPLGAILDRTLVIGVGSLALIVKGRELTLIAAAALQHVHVAYNE
jgi:hypothetical protein